MAKKSSLWMAEVEFMSSQARAFGDSPESALETLVKSWKAYCQKIGRGDPDLMNEYRDSIHVMKCDADKGYVLGVVDSFWHDEVFNASDERFDGFFTTEDAPKLSI